MADRSLFISSCSRRDLARRRSGRAPAWGNPGRAPAPRLLLTLAVLALALAAVLAARGGF